MREGSLDAPIRHPIDWNNPEYYDLNKIEDEMERVFDICHGCRRCFNLCDSFPTLFDMIDESETEEVDGLDKGEDYRKVVDLCTLCDMCFLTKCPYVPPHEFDLDFPHLMLRYRAAIRQQGEKNADAERLTHTDRNGKMAAPFAGIANWAAKTDNKLTRPIMESLAGIDRRVDLPSFESKPFTTQAKNNVPMVNTDAPAHGRKAVIYATCFVNYQQARTGTAARKVLAHNGVDTQVVYPGCCGMPKLEQGAVNEVAEQALKVVPVLLEWVDKGYDVISLTSSCSLMMKFEWPLILPENEQVKRLAQHVADIDEYMVDIAKKEGLAEGMNALDGGVTMHLSCHARAQNMGQKGAELLKHIPDTKIDVLERCSGHGGTFGVLKETFDAAVKVGKNTARAAKRNDNEYVASECPLAAKHILQVMDMEGAENIPDSAFHPIELMAKAYGL
ncbi:MAG TPA: glycerol-3-phosphate dehydrogenase [Alphaproteobacteria bacterium]|nr:glycerol-3-phosphate dehydrogenase [Paracoccaceae bacterium]RCL81666.1 MAG: glycerol-3-phosphate dehydrogenase [SAR116 cluster bacterium]RPH13405.1 MAG: glycerol-3-phosphate dehydrogenase [Alphaproteobacteria bacterium TMED150]HBQ23486.1 glycerol-3-phosphate dehydrogenase [Alphaproteobacteria bacterium]HCY48473.1 glycerol-3-phosphate dehydrogenase [Alphaproteobacteria bacterium]